MNATMTHHCIELEEGGVTFPRGFTANGLHCGARYKNKDLALLWSHKPASVAGVFTTNLVKAPPVEVCQQQLHHGLSHGVVVNSGNANACTGPQGFEDAWEMINLTAQMMEVEPEKVMVCSTGLIGRQLPMDKLREARAKEKSSSSVIQ